MNLQLELYKFQQELAVKIPPEKAAIILTTIENLAEDFKNRRNLRIGDTAPDFILSNTQNEKISLSDKLENGAVLLSFFRGTWCPYCSLELRAYQRVLPKIRALGSEILAVSPQTLNASQKTIKANALSYDLLSDLDCKV
ncbi:MAG: peroxiredoxin family protein, partial [Microcystaceae cyanobacterium]